ncbi:MAG: M23 family metallopeptidase [Thermoanaerobaculia bacterium]
MEIQLHPATGRGSVRSFLLGRRTERGILMLVGVWAIVSISLIWTAPVMTLRWLRHGHRADIARDSSALRGSERRLAESAVSLRDRASAIGDRLARIAFLYDVPAAQWPRELDPEGAALSAGTSPVSLDGLERYIAAMERGRLLLAGAEAADPQLPRRVPSVLPLSARLFAPSALFGPRVSPWTGEQEFFPGVDLATAAGTSVIAPGAGRVAFAGRVRPGRSGWLGRVGNVVVVDHGGGLATAYGHLSRTDVRVGQRIDRGGRLGLVGETGWALVPQLHYELWKHVGGRWRPTDPLFAILDRRLDTAVPSLEGMRRAIAPDPVEPLPGRW